MTSLTTYLENVRKRAESATEGPYYVEYTEPNEGIIKSKKHNNWIMNFSTDDACREAAHQDDNNMELFAHSRQDIPALLDMVEVLVNNNEGIDETLKQMLRQKLESLIPEEK